jgi:hypothetical protein
MPNTIEIPDDVRELLLSLAGGGEIYAYAISDDRRSIHLRLFVDGAPFLHAYERDAAGEYQLTGVNALGQVKF